MELTLLIIGAILGIVGLLGAVIPAIPGTILSYIGFLCVYFVGDTSSYHCACKPLKMF